MNQEKTSNNIDSEDDESSLFQRAQAWSERDPNPASAEFVQNLMKQAQNGVGAEEATTAARQELNQLFPASNERIRFGTAGLRSTMKPGPLGMNDLVVVQAAQGMARYCMNNNTFPGNETNDMPTTTTTTAVDEHSTKNKRVVVIPRVVIGYDHRCHPTLHVSSLSFALLTALVFQHAGWDCFLLDGFVPTPLVPFTMSRYHKNSDEEVATSNKAVTEEDADDDNDPNNVIFSYETWLGIMITASHNPKQDAGYKVYWKDGCQIRSPIDQGMAESILQNLEPWIDYRQRLTALRQACPHDPCLGLSRPQATQQMIQQYFQAMVSSGLVTGQTKALLRTTTSMVRPPPKFCYTAMHGIGYRLAQPVFETVFGLPPFVSVPAQQEPDPAFPTVPFPNPEEKGALDLAMACARQHGCSIVLANDPDADRLAVAEYDSDSNDWTIFTGDQIGTMLGYWLWQQYMATSGADDDTTTTTNRKRTPAMCASTVSSKLLAEIARVEGIHFEETLTGFKWIGSRAAALESSGLYRTLFCYEEAIGFCCVNGGGPESLIFDKDGLSALGVFAELTLSCYCRDGQTLVEHMQRLYDKYGEFVSNNGYYFVQDPSIIAVILEEITSRFETLSYVGSYAVESIRYLGEPGYDSTQPDQKPTLPCSKSSPMLTLRFTNGCVAQFRASGTEPKLKYYIELKGAPGVSREDVARELTTMSSVILEEILKPSKYGLKKR